MGSWNKTCGLSGLPIFYNEPVVMVVLEQNLTEYPSRSTGSGFWKPIMMPIYSQYNDHGGGQESSGIGIDVILKGLKQSVIEKEVGENEFHQPAVVRDELDIDNFFRLVHEGRLQVKDRKYNGDELFPEIDFVMIKQSLFDDVLTNFKFRDYVGEGLGNSGKENVYLEFNYEDVTKDIKAWVERAAQCNFLMPSEMGSQFRKVGEINLVDKFFRQAFNESSNIGGVSMEIIEATKDDPERAEALIAETLKVLYMHRFMDGIRKFWSPGAFEGSQEADYDNYKFLIGSMQKEIELDFQEREDMDEDDEYENSLR